VEKKIIMSLQRASPDRFIAAADRRERPADVSLSQRDPGRMSVRSSILIAAILAVFAILHFVGDSLIAERTHRSQGETGPLIHRGD
jgi:hypothetical protein